MNSVLISAVLSSCADYGALFECLSGPGESFPDPEHVEALTAVLEGLGPLLLSESTRFTETKKRCLQDMVESVCWGKCLSLLSVLTVRAGGGPGSREDTAAVCGLLRACVPLCSQTRSEELLVAALSSLQLPEEEPDPGRLSVEVATEVVSALVPCVTQDEALTLSTLTSVLSSIRALPDLLLSRVLVRVVVPLLSGGSRATLNQRLSLVLEDLLSCYSSDRSPALTQRTLLCVTALSDHLLVPHTTSPPSYDSDPRLSVHFWRMIQDGLIHRDGLSRRRALYLLRRSAAVSVDQAVDWPPATWEQDEILFRWTPSKHKLLREFWEDYFLVMETLEENQVHVVRPVLNRIDTLIQTAVSDCEASDQGLLHPSWLLCVYQRMFHSENKTLMREGVFHLLELQILCQPAFASAFSLFIVGPFLDVLSETSLFYRSTGQNVGDCPELGVKLKGFLRTFFSSLPLDDRANVLLQLLQRLGSKHWCAVPLLFLSQALTHVPPGPLLGDSGLTALREVLRCTMITHQVLLRGAAQCFLLNSALSLTAVTTVTLDHVFSFLVHFRSDESLCRRTKLWDQVCDWLSANEGHFKHQNMTGEAAEGLTSKGYVRLYVEGELLTYLRVPASTGESERLPDGRDADKLARAILMCADMERSHLHLENSKTLESLLSPLLGTLSRLSTNVYLPQRKSDSSLQLVLRLLQLGDAPNCQPEDSVAVALETLIFQVVEPIQEFLLRRLCGELLELVDLQRAELYITVLRQLVALSCSTPQHCSKIQHGNFGKLFKCSLSVLGESSLQVPSVVNQVTKAVSMASMAMVCDFMGKEWINLRSETDLVLEALNDYFYTLTFSACPASLGNINKCLLKPENTDSSGDFEAQSHLLQDWGRVGATFMRDQWICFNFLMKVAVSIESVKNLKASLSCSIEALALLPSDLVLPVFTFMETLLPHLVHEEEDLCVEALSQSWDLVQGLTTNAQDFWPALKAFTSMAFQHKMLQLTSTEAPTLLENLRRISKEMMVLSQSKSGVFGVLVKHCCLTWLITDGGISEQADAVFSTVFNYINIITEACVYGPVIRKDQRLIQDVHIYVEQLGQNCAANVAVKSDNRDDQLPRICVVAFLHSLDPSHLLHQQLMEEVVLDLLKKDNDISKSKVRYYSNSLQHRVKNRVWQTLLLLLPKLKEEFMDTLSTRVFEAGLCANQPSVKYLIEWMMIVILIRFPQYIETFWNYFNTDHEHTKTSVCTFLSVLVHFNHILPNLKDKAAQLCRALDVILQSCFNHNFSVRLYALLALKRVWNLTEKQATEEVEALGGLSSVVRACLSQAETMQSSGNANKNWIRIQEHFFFSAFHPTTDYSLETIFHTFPSLSELSDDEWIPTWKFEKLSNFPESPSIPLQNSTPDLKQLQPGDWIQQDRSEQEKDERWAEVQKKITPWRLEVQDQEPELQLVSPQRAARLGKLHSSLLVVASLIDKPTNLGGLCRTCEIFNASALVLDSLRHIHDKHFQSLSVSSELWLPLLEVKPLDLSEFLLIKKNEGYCIVGVEQTANSHSLQDYQFPEKTLLLLG
ncbi:probable methyltransferase TARBP1 isoform X2 [Gouania willdenowi]|nr:probable methyltransferase TARBP1 isoform X2 [Gouania willdenowi]